MNKQQSGRGSISKLALQSLPILDVTALSDDRLAKAVKPFDAMAEKELLTFHEINKDSIRKEVDEKFVRQVLGLLAPLTQAGGQLELLRKKLAQEPSIRGHKS